MAPIEYVYSFRIEERYDEKRKGYNLHVLAQTLEEATRIVRSQTGAEDMIRACSEVFQLDYNYKNHSRGFVPGNLPTGNNAGAILAGHGGSAGLLPNSTNTVGARAELNNTAPGQH